jgi:nucleoid-associated protein YgaU
MPGENSKQNPTSGSLAVRRMHRMVVGDSLASLAYAEYGDPTLWRYLASFNRIDDPLRIPQGSVVLLPSAAELLDSAG